ncbi:MAG: DUF5683 domain-containing protein [Candidatus Kryptonium sp.]
MLKKILLLIIFAQAIVFPQSSDESFISKRKLTALTYSTFIPGAGQFYLGHKIKGAFFTLTTFGSLITAVVSQNNLVGGNERLENLEIQYQSTMNWERAEQIWQEMLQVKANIDRDYKRRNLFLGITAGLWVVNIIDVLLFTPDKGSGDIFGENIPGIGVESKGGRFMISAKFKF